jgi:hypothetical protein
MDLEEGSEPTPEVSSAPVPGVIENPVINSPYEETQRHFVFASETDGDTLCVGVHQ